MGTAASMNKPYKLAVKAIICDSAGRCLLIRRSQANQHFVGKWEWPGGKVDAGEDLSAALTREVREETALEVEVTGLAGAVHYEMPKVHVILLCLAARAGPERARAVRLDRIHARVPCRRHGADRRHRPGNHCLQAGR